jgi:hypothetical protein
MRDRRLVFAIICGAALLGGRASMQDTEESAVRAAVNHLEPCRPTRGTF